MASIKKLKPGQKVWEIKRQKMGHTRLSYGALYSLIIKEVHENHVIASWNGNPPQKFSESSIKKWKINKPEPKRTVMGTPSYL